MRDTLDTLECLFEGLLSVTEAVHQIEERGYYIQHLDQSKKTVVINKPVEASDMEDLNTLPKLMRATITFD